MTESSPRVSPVPPEERTEQQQKLMNDAGKEYRVFSTMIRHPDVFGAYLPLGSRLLGKSLLTGREREILILRAAYGARADYEWGHHARIGSRAGIEDEVIAQLGTAAPSLDPSDALLATAADELLTDHRIGEKTWNALAERFDEKQIIEICMLVGSYVMLGGALNSMQVQLEDGFPIAPWL